MRLSSDRRLTTVHGGKSQPTRLTVGERHPLKKPNKGNETTLVHVYNPASGPVFWDTPSITPTPRTNKIGRKKFVVSGVERVYYYEQKEERVPGERTREKKMGDHICRMFPPNQTGGLIPSATGNNEIKARKKDIPRRVIRELGGVRQSSADKTQAKAQKCLVLGSDAR
ncbi:hypothetical protein RUM44_003686 [Polyplax serrata]|uniref:Uncharacterized protein n=1 Tax=Polyplax serrata TaxID=468196 RepID=A0ABR1AH53_POLSC